MALECQNMTLVWSHFCNTFNINLFTNKNFQHEKICTIFNFCNPTYKFK